MNKMEPDEQIKDVLPDSTFQGQFVAKDAVCQTVEKYLESAKMATNMFTQEIFKQLQYLVSTYFQYRDKPVRLNAVAEVMVKHGICELYKKMWNQFHENAEKFYNNLTSEPVDIYLMLTIIWWNFSDCCPIMAVGAYNANLIEYFLKNFSVQQLGVSELSNNRIRYIVKGTLAILHNCLRHFPHNKSLVRELNGIRLVEPYYRSCYLIIKAKVIVVMSYCVNEEEQDGLFCDKEVTNFIAQLFKSSLDAENHIAKKYEFSAEEIVEAIRKIAISDKNKKLILESEIPILIIQMLNMQQYQQAETRVAVNCLWTLSFYKENNILCIKFPDLKNQLRNVMHEVQDNETKKSCSGALFVLFGEEQKQTPSKSKPSGGHVMLSYQWDNQYTILKVRDFLQENKLDVWIDVDKMKHSILEAMAIAVEQSSVVVIALSEKYKESSACRTEAEYAYKLKKPLVFLMLQSGYLPDGWLGALAGNQLYYDFSKEENMTPEMMDKFADSVLTHINKQGAVV